MSRYWRYRIRAEIEGTCPAAVRILSLEGASQAAELARCLMACFGIPAETGFELEIDGLLWIADGEHEGNELDPRMPMSRLMGMVSTGTVRFEDGHTVMFSVEDIEEIEDSGPPVCLGGEGGGFDHATIGTLLADRCAIQIFESSHMNGVPLTEDEIRDYYEDMASELADRLLNEAPEKPTLHGECVRSTHSRLSDIFGDQEARKIIVATLGEMMLRCDMENAMYQTPDAEGHIDPMDPADIPAEEYVRTMEMLSGRLLGAPEGI